MQCLKNLGLVAGQRVALEGAPIYLVDMPGSAHRQTNAVITVLGKALVELGCLPELHVLLDEHTCSEEPCARERYCAELSLDPIRVVLESEMVRPSWNVLERIPAHLIQHNGGTTGQQKVLHASPQPILVTNRGQPTCALMDSAFQLSKSAALSIIVHPEKMMVSGSQVDFRLQQEGLCAVLSALRNLNQEHPALPWELGMVHLWLDEHGQIVRSWRARNKGRQILRKHLAGVEEINEAVSARS